MSSSIRQSFSCPLSQVCFDSKLLPSLSSLGKENRLAIILVQEKENQILAIAHTDSAMGAAEAAGLEGEDTMFDEVLSEIWASQARLTQDDAVRVVSE